MNMRVVVGAIIGLVIGYFVVSYFSGEPATSTGRNTPPTSSGGNTRP
jgi:hypothetical protein